MAAPSVIVSAPEPATSVSTFENRARIGEITERYGVVAAAQVDRPLEICVAKVIVSAAVLPISVSTFETVPSLANLPSVRLSAPDMRSMLLELVEPRAERDRIGIVAADQRLDVRDRRVVGCRAESERIGAIAEVDRALRDLARKGDDVGIRAADERLDVGNRAGVAEVTEQSSLSAPEPRLTLSEVVRTVPSVTVSDISLPTIDFDVRNREVIGELAERQLVGARSEIDRSLGSAAVERDRIGVGAADQRLDVGDARRVRGAAEREAVRAAAQIDRALGDLRRDRDDVGGRVAEDRLDVGDGPFVGELAEREAVRPRAEIDAACRCKCIAEA